MKVATAAYPMDFLDSWEGYVRKLESWVKDAAGNGAELLVFPEYGAMELATLAGRRVARDLQASLKAVSDLVPNADATHQRLAERYGVHILAASAPVFDSEAAVISGRPVNRARLFTPDGEMAIQDKQIMTRFEREDVDVVSGGKLGLFSTKLGKIGILICYDAEFPLLGRALREADVILVPSCTEALAGYWRVRVGAMARALENQCVTVMASTVGACDWSDLVDLNTGAGGVFGPPDKGLPGTGVLAEGVLNRPGWTYADINLEAIAEVRRDGHVLNRTHWDEQSGRDGLAPVQNLR